MRNFLFIAFFTVGFCAEAQTSDTLEGWWTFQDSTHYFQDRDTLIMDFVGPEVYDMDSYYEALAPYRGFPLQVIIVANRIDSVLEVYLLDPSPEGCDD